MKRQPNAFPSSLCSCGGCGCGTKSDWDQAMQKCLTLGMDICGPKRAYVIQVLPNPEYILPFHPKLNQARVKGKTPWPDRAGRLGPLVSSGRLRACPPPPPAGRPESGVSGTQLVVWPGMCQCREVTGYVSTGANSDVASLH